MAHHQNDVSLTGVERNFGRDELIVSKTDLKGRITYGNKLFINLAGYSEQELIGAPHSTIRHPDMPRCVFELLWNTLGEGRELFAYVINRSSNGDHYWVFAHVTPNFNESGQITGYHSSRRVADRRVLNEVIIPLYKNLSEEERRHGNAKDGMAKGRAMLNAALKEKGKAYDELIFSLARA
ncbi:MAG: PAS domain S-box protein [Alphaproteobacteria bacterium]|nr:PAS domain S-box protein [Alphaproteobacteria bacterium]